MDDKITQLKSLYELKKSEIIERLKEFRRMEINGDDEEIFAELSFCILTPQSKARSCWDAIVKIKKNDLLLNGDYNQIEKELNAVRFKNKKAKYIVDARNFFANNGNIHIKSLLSKFDDVNKCRMWLVENIKGIGYKESSHFLRNIGFGEEFAILDRHILKNLKQLKIIEDIPKSISKTKYMKIEKDMKEFARQIDIPFSHLDLLMWCKETGEIFK